MASLQLCGSSRNNGQASTLCGSPYSAESPPEADEDAENGADHARNQPTPGSPSHSSVDNSVALEELQRKEEELVVDAAELYAQFKQSSGLRALKLHMEDFLKKPTDADPGTLLYLQWQVGQFIHHKPVQLFFITLVCINAILIGLQADYGSGEIFWVYTEATFIGIFIIEIFLKLFALGMYFFVDRWNVLDFVIVTVSTVEVFGILINAQTGTNGLSAFRLLRVMRVIRLIGFLQRLNLLVQAFLAALNDIVWVLMLVILLLYIFAILARGFFGQNDKLEESGFDVSGHFGSVNYFLPLFLLLLPSCVVGGVCVTCAVQVPLSMATLFQASHMHILYLMYTLCME